jgi:hypothetical protein
MNKQNLSKPPEHVSHMFDHLSPQEVVASFYGYWYRLQDLQELQLRGQRVPGGLSGRIELASLHWQMANKSIESLVDTDPVKARAIQEWLAVSSVPVILDKAKGLAERLMVPGQF